LKEKLLVRLLSDLFMPAMLIKAVVVTGSSRSIGAAVVKRLARDGASVVINYASNEAAAKEVADEINATRSGAAVIVKADVSTVESCKYLLDETLKAFGRIDILVLNAGIMGMKTLRDIDEKFFDDHFLINVKGPFFLVQAAEKHLKEGERTKLLFCVGLGLG
jgi:3-oxoacyl-[acyl-carrier protein] reductase